MPLLAPPLWERLYQEAREVSRQAYCPFSRFPVGAAVLAANGAMFRGCNVENSSYGLTICAERNGVFQAVATGVREIIAVAIYTPTTEVAAPCGACCQVLLEFGQHAEVHSVCDGDAVLRKRVSELVPESFLLTAPGSAWQVAHMRPVICIDLDLVVLNTDPVLSKLITEGAVIHSGKEGHSSSRKLTAAEWQKVAQGPFPQSRLQGQLQPVPGAVDALKQLLNVYDIHLLTDRPLILREATRGWLDAQGLTNAQVHFTTSDEPAAPEHAFALISDKPHDAIAAARQGFVHSCLLHSGNIETPTTPHLKRAWQWPEVVGNLLGYFLPEATAT